MDLTRKWCIASLYYISTHQLTIPAPRSVLQSHPAAFELSGGLNRRHKPVEIPGRLLTRREGQFIALKRAFIPRRCASLWKNQHFPGKSRSHVCHLSYRVCMDKVITQLSIGSAARTGRGRAVGRRAPLFPLST
jgi:hypothetical protein